MEEEEEEEEEEVCPSRQSSVGSPPLLGEIEIITVILFIILVLVSQVVNWTEGARVTRDHGVGGTTNGTETQWSSRKTYGDMVSCQNRQIPLLCLPAFKNLKAMRWGQDTAVSVGICRRQQTL
jgi:hypothetical protein